MFSLDMRTVQNTQGLIFIVCFIIILILWLQTRSRFNGLSYWVVGFALCATGNILIGFRDFIPVWLSVPFANSCYVSGYACLFMGLQRFVGKKVISVKSAIALAVFAAFVFVHVYFTFIEANLLARIVNVSVAVVLLCGMCFLLLNRTRTIAQQYTLGPQIGFLSITFLSIARLAGMPLIKTNDLMASGLYDTTIMLMLSITIIFLAFSLVLMVNRLSLAETIQAEMVVRQSEAKIKATFNATSIGFATLVNRKIQDINEAGCKMLGYDRDELLGQDTQIWYPTEEEYKADQSLYSGLAKHNSARGETRFSRKDGTIINVIINISALNSDDLSQGVVLSVLDITERKQMEQKLLEMATHDALTGLPNRTLLYDRCGIAMANAQRNKKNVAIMTLDLDLFKDVNDTLGHDIGDKVLIAATRRLIETLRKSDTVARMGGDEFVLLLWEVDDKEAAIVVAEKMMNDFRQPFIIDGHSIKVTVSIGIAIFPENGDTIEELLKSSDKSLYTAKQNGRDRFAI